MKRHYNSHASFLYLFLYSFVFDQNQIWSWHVLALQKINNKICWCKNTEGFFWVDKFWSWDFFGYKIWTSWLYRANWFCFGCLLRINAANDSSKVYFVFSLEYTVNSVLTDISIRQTPLWNGHLEFVPAFLCSLYLTLYKTDIYLGRTASAGPKGVCLRESWL